MSIVGPRPCIAYEADKYLDWQMQRFDGLPGLTGLWQVSGKNRTTFDEMMRLDIRYVQTKTFLMDLRIILMTVPAMLIQFLDTRRQRRLTKVESASPFAATASRIEQGRGLW
jgi:lipopolysaccharide/colanic/teichoic acid biosynthesis glycosyltransferase